ncbi:hypothetical protein GCM10007205_05950 [Oxalicibacterium flavum]|uniref:Uncharacterized protein n=1 Tax=Oxalicibacterium flavum TaxID=179467 RepID=A0A8J2ULE7_9BURK|nr:hypothetical protein [Oxalicibacterium flavum]GGB99435.1 hypothetical protein GCM10007205_05950 [Oxalicibacterium flavum]
MIANIGNAWPVQRTDATRIAGDLLTRVDSRTSAVNPPAGREQEEGPRREDQAERKAGNERQVGDELAMQLQQSRLARADAEAGLPGTQTVSSLDTNNDYLDRAAQQLASDEGNNIEAGAGAAAQPLLPNSADGGVRADDSEFEVGIDRIDAGTARTDDAGQPAAGSAIALAAAGSGREAADLNRDGAIGPQESSVHQASQTEPVQAEAQAQQQQAAERIATRLAQTYGRFDPEIANATLRVNPFHIAA